MISFLSFFLCLGVYVLFLLTAATLLLLYPEDPESWLIEAGVLVAGSVLVAHVFSFDFSWLWWRSLCTGAFQSSSFRLCSRSRHALLASIVQLGRSASFMHLTLQVSAHLLASGQSSCVTGCIAGDLGGVHSRVYLYLFLALPSEFSEGVRVASYLMSSRLSQQPIFRFRRSC